MSDVVEEFSALECVCERLQKWRDDDMSAYTDAFVPMCLPKIISPLVRLQILFWNPLTVGYAVYNQLKIIVIHLDSLNEFQSQKYYFFLNLGA